MAQGHTHLFWFNYYISGLEKNWKTSQCRNCSKDVKNCYTTGCPVSMIWGVIEEADSQVCLDPGTPLHINTLRPRQNGRHFADGIFKCIFLHENVWILIKNSLKFVPKGSINNIPALVQIMAWRRSGAKPLSESMLVSLPTHICITRPQWVNTLTWDQIVTILQRIYSNAFSSLKKFEFRFNIA